MSRLRKEFAVVPGPARVVAVLACMALGLLVFFASLKDPEIVTWPLGTRILLSVVVAPVMGILVLLYGYVYGDARRRGMRAVLWLLLAIFVPNTIGIILYFLLRVPLPVPCTACSQPVKPGFAFCPSCGGALSPACPQCRRAVEAGWSNCAYCGTKLSQS